MWGIGPICVGGVLHVELVSHVGVVGVLGVGVCVGTISMRFFLSAALLKDL